jgi:hypothetical protein
MRSLRNRIRVLGCAAAVCGWALAVSGVAAAGPGPGPGPDRTPPTIRFSSLQTPDALKVMFDIELTDARSGVYWGEMSLVGGPTFPLHGGANHVEMYMGAGSGQIPAGIRTVYVSAMDNAPSHNSRGASYSVAVRNHPRSFEEQSALDDLRAVISGEYAFSSSNYGYFAEPYCLLHPGVCIPGMPDTPFLSEGILGIKDGYNREFHAGVPGPLPHQLGSFAVTALPATVDGFHGSFCAASSGLIYENLDGGPISVDSDGSCPRGLVVVP